MTQEGPKSLDEIAIAQKFELEELLDRPSLVEMVRSFEALFGVPLRIYSVTGQLLADTQSTPSLYKYLETTLTGRQAVHQVIQAVRRALPEEHGTIQITCFSGALYFIHAIVFEGRILGRTILGPFLEVEAGASRQELPLPPQLHLIDPSLDSEVLWAHYKQLPQLDGLTCQRMDVHLRSTLDLLIFSGLKAHLASSMHVASVRESYRELTEKNQKLQQAYDRLKELDRLKSNFLATVSHELRTPLTSIIGYSEMLLEGIAGDLEPEQNEFISTIHEKGEQLLELIKSLLDLSKLESGTMSMRKTQVSIAQLLERVVSTLTPLAKKQGVALSFQLQEGLPSLEADGERLGQVLLNLTENAIKFTPAQGCVRIEAALVDLDQDVTSGVGGILFASIRRQAIEIRVLDTGIGISESERERIFDAFYQVDSSSTREIGGTGLGLSIVKRLVQAHDGEVRIESNQPQGSVFIVTLPLFRSLA